MRVAIELAFTGCMAEARSILRDAIEFVAHAHATVSDPELQKKWLSKNNDKAALKAFKEAFEWHKTQGLFKGLDELHRTWKKLSEAGSHASIDALVDRFVPITSDGHIEFRLNYTGVEDTKLWAKSLFSMLLTCFTMEQTFFGDYQQRLKLDDQLVRMRTEFGKYKEKVRRTLIAHFKVEPPGGIFPPPKPTIYSL